MSLDALFYPKSICLIGSSRIRERGNLVSPEIFSKIMNNLRNFYKGKLYVVDIVKSTTLPIADLYVVTLPEEETLNLLKDFRCKCCIILPGNFTQKTLLKQKMKEKEIRFLGPNSVCGVINTQNGLNTTFEKGIMPDKGNTSFILQSGGVGATILDFSYQSITGADKIVWIGNAWDIGFTELLEYLNREKSTKSIGMYLEGVQDGQKFVETVKKINKPVVALKGGVTKESGRRAMTHTSSLVGSPEIYSSVFKQLGIVEVKDVSGLYEVTNILSEEKSLSGDRVAIVSNVGGPAILAADYVYLAGLKLAKLSEETQNTIKRKFVEIEPINPVDLIADANRERLEFCLKHVLKDKNVDSVLVITMLKSCLLKPEETRVIGKIIKSFKKPIVYCVPAKDDWRFVNEVMKKEGVYVFDDLKNAVSALKSMHEYFMSKNKK